LEQPALRAALPWLAQENARGAFFLGIISPDVRAVSGQAREVTHFYDIPPRVSTPAHEAMLNAWPELRQAPTQGRDRATFVAGYMSHLIMDETWLETIVMPGLFIDGQGWGTKHPHWRVYSLLMTYLEYQAEARLKVAAAEVGTMQQITAASPAGWLPFVEDRHLVMWRDHVVEMIVGDGARRTSHAFARSLGLSEDEIEAIVTSEERMAGEIHPVISRELLQHFGTETELRTREMILGYLAGVGS
jgi:hypothetical protein